MYQTMRAINIKK